MERNAAYYAVMAFYIDLIMRQARIVLYLNYKYGTFYCPLHGWESVR